METFYIERDISISRAMQVYYMSMYVLNHYFMDKRKIKTTKKNRLFLFLVVDDAL